MSRPRIVLLGDSITVGCRETGVTEDTTYPSLLQRLLDQAGLDVELIVSALHGVYMEYAVRRFERMVGRHRADYLLILLGANDAVPAGGNSSTSTEDFQTALKTLASQCLVNGVIPIIASPPPRSDEKCCSLLRGYAGIAQAFAEKSELPFIDLFAKLSDERFLSELLPDCQHPNPTANEIIAALVAECLLKLPGIGGRKVSTSAAALAGKRNVESRYRSLLQEQSASAAGHGPSS